MLSMRFVPFDQHFISGTYRSSQHHYGIEIAACFMKVCHIKTSHRLALRNTSLPVVLEEMFNRQLLLCALTCSLVVGQVEVSLDDNSPNITYTGAWHAISASQPCTSCALNPDASKIYLQTWHDGQAQVTGDRSITIKFSGTFFLRS